jgi:hypothetical protein
MGMSNMQVQQPMQQGSGKGMGGMPPQGESQLPSFDGAPMGQMPPPMQRQIPMGGPQGQQPSFGQPNMYSNTIPSWDNASIMPGQQSGGEQGQAFGGFERAQTSFQNKSISPGKSGKGNSGGIFKAFANQNTQTNGQINDPSSF